MTTMICMVSGQPMPNLRPALCQNEDFKVRQVVLLVTEKMTKQAASLTAVLERNQRACVYHEVPDAYDLPALIAQFRKILDDINGNGIANLTGGTKMMSLALRDAVRGRDNWRTLYVREDTHQGQWLDGTTDQPFPIEAQMSLKDLLDAHGFDHKAPGSFHPTRAQRDFADWLLRTYYRNRNVIDLLNKVSYDASDKKKNIRKYFSEIDNGKFDKANVLPCMQPILERAQQVGLLELHEDHIFYPSKNHRKFICGVWLECAVENAVKRLEKQHPGLIDDIRAGIQFNQHRGEADVLVSRPTGLAVIECKTGSYGKEDGQIKAGDVIKQTMEQKKYGGLTTTNILVSLNPLGNDHAYKKAGRNHIRIIEGDMLGDLEHHLYKCLQ
ncbi:Card1-like endonuclease domain-containing protein [Luteithermobacter gelatinilyticus]|uniref:Card1-like endonuclease domain-containing protein n=1 Tax=Luteithermobacter gelatinilyticus TaxID=2582913 RepID=UPI00110676A3|nr:DUF1887 family CARF protein [Luteithermobacter gelatinilyticus]